ncbi:MAG: hypothetical protein WBW27_26585 [Pseudolabrys sp.]|jgi:hypothetical protein
MSTAVWNIVGQNWTITAAPPGPNEPAPRSFAEQRWVLVLTGVIAYNERTPNGDIVVGIRGNNPHDWRRGGIRIPRLGSVSDAMFAMITRYGVTRPDDTGPLFSLEQWAPFIAVSSFLDLNEPPAPVLGQRASGAGVAVDLWRPTHFVDAWDANNVPIPNIFSGIDVDVAIYGQAILYRLSYNIRLIGKIAFGNRSPDGDLPTI